MLQHLFHLHFLSFELELSLVCLANLLLCGSDYSFIDAFFVLGQLLLVVLNLDLRFCELMPEIDYLPL